MPDEYNHKMSDLEFQKYNLKQTTELQEQDQEKQQELKAGFRDRVEDVGIGVLVEDESELAEGDEEDNVSLEMMDTDDDSMSLTGKKSDNSDEEAEFQTNVSFSGGYVPNTDLSRVDKGQGNP